MHIIGHRGAKGLAPENTLAAFAKALDYGVDEIECDVRVTSDGVPVLVHDAWLHDQAGSRLLITQHTLAELRGHKADLTTMQEAAELVNRKVQIQFEIKPGEPVKPIVETLQTLLQTGWQTSHFVLSSRDFRLLTALHATFPEIPTVVIEAWSGIRASRRARKLSTRRVSMNQLWLWRGFIGPVSRRGWQLSAYALNDPRRANRWEKYGLYGVITDYPDIFRKRPRT